MLLRLPWPGPPFRKHIGKLALLCANHDMGFPFPIDFHFEFAGAVVVRELEFSLFPMGAQDYPRLAFMDETQFQVLFVKE